MSIRHRSALVACAALLVLAFHIAVAWQDIETLARNGFLYDDSFYAFKIAANIAQGNGATFDGLHPTTGFQPLYILLLVPAFALAGGDLLLPIYLALSLLAVLTCLTAYLIYRIALRHVGWRPALIASLIWAFSPVVTKQGANGLETALASFMIALSVHYYLEKIRPIENPGARRFLILGVLLGLTVLSRIDGVLLLLALLLDYLVLLRRRRMPAMRLLRLAVVPLTVCALYGPWLLCNIVVCGTPLQDSGSATRFLSLAYAGYFGYGDGNMGPGGPDAAFILAHMKHAVSAMKVTPPLHLVFRLFGKAGGMLGSGGGLMIFENIVGLALLAAFGIAAFRWRKDERRKRRGELHFLLLFAVALLASYATVIFGMFYFLRYFYPVFLIACIYLAFILEDILNWCAGRRAATRRVLRIAAAAYVGLFCFFSYSQAFRSKPVYPFYDVARWVTAHTRAGERIGAFQCGTIGYLSNRQIINLDGKVNRGAFEAMRKGALEIYLREEKIDVVVDHCDILKIFFRDPKGILSGASATVACDAMRLPTGWMAYRTPVEGNGEDSWRTEGSEAPALHGNPSRAPLPGSPRGASSP